MWRNNDQTKGSMIDPKNIETQIFKYMAEVFLAKKSFQFYYLTECPKRIRLSVREENRASKA